MRKIPVLLLGCFIVIANTGCAAQDRGQTPLQILTGVWVPIDEHGGKIGSFSWGDGLYIPYDSLIIDKGTVILDALGTHKIAGMELVSNNVFQLSFYYPLTGNGEVRVSYLAHYNTKHKTIWFEDSNNTGLLGPSVSGPDHPWRKIAGPDIPLPAQPTYNGPAISVDVAVEGSMIPNGGTFNLGTVDRGSSGYVATFILRNMSSKTLHFTGVPTSLLLEPKDAYSRGFNFPELSLPKALLAGNKTDFSVNLIPTSNGITGDQTVTVSIPNDSSDSNPFTFTLTANRP